MKLAALRHELDFYVHEGRDAALEELALAEKIIQAAEQVLEHQSVSRTTTDFLSAIDDLDDALAALRAASQDTPT